MADKKTYKLLGADGQIYESPTPGQFGGNGRARIYGRLDCSQALRAIREAPEVYKKTRVFFADEATALAAGYRPCGNCLREKYRQYKAYPEKHKAQFGIVDTETKTNN